MGKCQLLIVSHEENFIATLKENFRRIGFDKLWQIQICGIEPEKIITYLQKYHPSFVFYCLAFSRNGKRLNPLIKAEQYYSWLQEANPVMPAFRSFFQKAIMLAETDEDKEKAKKLQHLSIDHSTRFVELVMLVQNLLREAPSRPPFNQK